MKSSVTEARASTDDVHLAKPIRVEVRRPMWSRVWIVDPSKPFSSDDANGSQATPLRTINAAAQLAKPGDTVRVMPGVYRERVSPARGGEPGRPIVYEAADPHRCVLRGSEAAGDAARIIAPGLVSVDLKPEWTPHRNPFATKLAGRQKPGATCGQVFYNGRLLREETDPAYVRASRGAWCTQDDGRSVLISLPPGVDRPLLDRLELSVRDRVFAPLRRGLQHITIRGFVIEHCGNNFPSNFWDEAGQPQAGALSTRGGSHWTIEHNIVRLAKAVGIDCGYEGPIDLDGLDQPPSESCNGHVLSHNRIEENGACGIAAANTRNLRIVGNTVERNNTLGFSAAEKAGIKLHFFFDGRIEANLVRDNDGPGIWLDNQWVGSRVTRNCVIGNTGAGIFVELGEGPLLVDRNVIAHTRAGQALAGDGLYAHDASGVTFAHNLTCFNAHFGAWLHHATDRDGSACSEWRVLNNVFISDSCGTLSLPVPNASAEGNRADYNAYAGLFDRLTIETTAERQSPPRFLLNTSKDRVTADLLYERIGDALTRAGRSSLPLDLDEFRHRPSLSLDEWQVASGLDRHSRYVTVARPVLGTHSAEFRLLIGTDFDMACPPVEGIDADYYGEALADQPRPGPFAALEFEPRLADRTRWTRHRGPYADIPTATEYSTCFTLWPIRTDLAANHAAPGEASQNDNEAGRA